jgi:hypothetical protein
MSAIDATISGPRPIAAVIETVRGDPPTGITEKIALFRVPHLIWQCSISGPMSSFPIMFDTLIDDGLHTVLICEDFAQQLGL